MRCIVGAGLTHYSLRLFFGEYSIQISIEHEIHNYRFGIFWNIKVFTVAIGLWQYRGLEMSTEIM